MTAPHVSQGRPSGFHGRCTAAQPTTRRCALLSRSSCPRTDELGRQAGAQTHPHLHKTALRGCAERLHGRVAVLRGCGGGSPRKAVLRGCAERLWAGGCAERLWRWQPAQGRADGSPSICWPAGAGPTVRPAVAAPEEESGLVKALRHLLLLLRMLLLAVSPVSHVSPIEWHAACLLDAGTQRVLPARGLASGGGEQQVVKLPSRHYRCTSVHSLQSSHILFTTLAAGY